MTSQEKTEALYNMLNCYINETNLTNKEIEETETFVEELKEQLNLSGVVKSFTADFQINDNVTFKQNRSGKVTDVYENELQIKGINGNYKTICKTDVIEKH